MRAPILLALASLCVLGCRVEDDDIVGRYEVTWSRTETCGETGILASPTQMQFVVALRQSTEAALQWIERGETNTLQAVGDGSYSGSIYQVMDMRVGIEGADGLPPCSVERLDTLVATPDEVRVGDFDTFEATLTFQYAELAGSQCGDLMTAEGLAGGLPCQIAYDGIGARVE
jgi:hypothetical protein